MPFAIANDTEYSLRGGVWAGDKDRATAVARRIRTGQIEVNGGAFNPNAPLGGYKKSGYGPRVRPPRLRGVPPDQVDAAVGCGAVAAPETEEIERLVADVVDHGVRQVHVLAWRDLDDDDAGGSEVHADEFERRWATAGLEILHRTSVASGRPPTDRRHGYDVVRRGSRYSVFPRAALAELTGRMGRSDALVEIWNGVPWASPLWYRRRPRMTILHHVHGPMWDQMLPAPFAGAGRLLVARLAPPWYRAHRGRDAVRSDPPGVDRPRPRPGAG